MIESMTFVIASACEAIQRVCSISGAGPLDCFAGARDDVDATFFPEVPQPGDSRAE